MKDWAALQQRYLRDNPAVQLGGLASNLSRIAWCAERGAWDDAAPIVLESKYFTEWAAPSCSLEQQRLLAELQIELALWERGWGSRLNSAKVAQQASAWSAKLLELSGLVS